MANKNFVVKNGITVGTTDVVSSSGQWIGGSSAGTYSNSAFDSANTADQKAVTSGSYANGAFSASNSAGSYANTGLQFANSAGSYANSAFTSANTANGYCVLLPMLTAYPGLAPAVTSRSPL